MHTLFVADLRILTELATFEYGRASDAGMPAEEAIRRLGELTAKLEEMRGTFAPVLEMIREFSRSAGN